MDFKEFYKLQEKDMSGEEMSKSLFLYADITKDVQQKYKDLVSVDGDLKEDEIQPHMTFLYLPHPVEDIDEEKLYEVIKPILSGKSFTIKTKKYDVFKGVEGGTRDCLIVKLEVPQELKDVREEVKKAIEKAGGKFEETYKEYKPHMTLGYYSLGSKFNLPKFESEEITIPEIKFQYGGSDKPKRSF